MKSGFVAWSAINLNGITSLTGKLYKYRKNVVDTNLSFNHLMGKNAGSLLMLALSFVSCMVAYTNNEIKIQPVIYQ